MRLYHGSRRVIEAPEFGAGKPYNDYGLGFYCTQSEEMASEWAVGMRRDGFVNAYEIDLTGLDVLDLDKDPGGVLAWLAVLLQNREFSLSTPLEVEAREYLTQAFTPDYQERDVIVGYRADDSYFSFAQDFVGGRISLRQLARAMKLGELGRQVVIKSQKAFGRIHFVGVCPVRAEDWYARRAQRDRAARRQYLDVERNAREKGDLFITHVIDEGVVPGDARL